MHLRIKQRKVLTYMYIFMKSISLGIFFGIFNVSNVLSGPRAMLVTTSKTIHCLPLIVYSCVNNTFYRAITRMPGIHTMCQIKKKVMRW